MKLSYLLLTPYNRYAQGYQQLNFKKVKNSPYFFDIDISVEKISKVNMDVVGVPVTVEYYLYDKKVVLAQCFYSISDQDDKKVSIKENVNKGLREVLLSEIGYKGDLVEEYSIILLDNIDSPSEYIRKNQYMLARLMRNADKKIELAEAKEILSSKVSYAKGDLTVVDWEGAMIFANDSDFESDIELLKVGNYQLLRYRMIDSDIENNLKTLRNKITKNKKSFLPVKNSILKSTVGTQLSLLLDFDKVDQSLLLVGDWYSAKLYKIIVEEFYLDDWKALVKDRLSSLSSIDETIRESLTFSWERFLDIVSIVGWAVLLVGYFFLYFKDAGF